jgi:hypothetical protein
MTEPDPVRQQNIAAAAPNMIGPNEAAAQAMRNAVMAAEAADNVQIYVDRLQAQIDLLNTTVASQSDTIARLLAATVQHACPANAVAATTRDASDHPLNIDECIKQGLCNCEVGYILYAQTWTPPV